MKQTTVEWLAWKFAVTNIEEFKDNFNDIIKQSKEMEKKQIIEVFDRGLITDNVYYGYDDKKAEKFYNKTFKSE